MRLVAPEVNRESEDPVVCLLPSVKSPGINQQVPQHVAAQHPPLWEMGECCASNETSPESALAQNSVGAFHPSMLFYPNMKENPLCSHRTAHSPVPYSGRRACPKTSATAQESALPSCCESAYQDPPELPQCGQRNWLEDLSGPHPPQSLPFLTHSVCSHTAPAASSTDLMKDCTHGEKVIS